MQKSVAMERLFQMTFSAAFAIAVVFSKEIQLKDFYLSLEGLEEIQTLLDIPRFTLLTTREKVLCIYFIKNMNINKNIIFWAIFR